MAVLDPNEIFFTAFEPQVQNRFIMYIDGIPSYLIKKAASPQITFTDIKLDHIIKNYEIQSENINILKDNLINLNVNNKLMQDNINIAHQKIDNLVYYLEKENKTDIEQKLNKFKKIIYTFSLYQLEKNKLYYLDTYKEIHENMIKKNNLKYEQFELIYTIDYNAKYIDIISKIKNKYKDNLIFFNSEIILNNITSSIIIEFIKEEVKKFN